MAHMAMLSIPIAMLTQMRSTHTAICMTHTVIMTGVAMIMVIMIMTTTTIMTGTTTTTAIIMMH